MDPDHYHELKFINKNDRQFICYWFTCAHVYQKKGEGRVGERRWSKAMIQEKKEIKLSLYYWLGELTSSGLAFIEYIIQSTDIKVSLCYFLWMLKKCDKNYRAKFVLRFRIIKCTAASWSTYDLIYLFQLLGWNQNLQKHDCFDEKFIILITIFSPERK